MGASAGASFPGLAAAFRLMVPRLSNGPVWCCATTLPETSTTTISAIVFQQTVPKNNDGCVRHTVARQVFDPLSCEPSFWRCHLGQELLFRAAKERSPAEALRSPHASLYELGKRRFDARCHSKNQCKAWACNVTVRCLCPAVFLGFIIRPNR